jgi:hypothetical protein
VRTKNHNKCVTCETLTGLGSEMHDYLAGAKALGESWRQDMPAHGCWVTPMLLVVLRGKCAPFRIIDYVNS